MSLHISFDDFQKMIDKECKKRTGHSIEDFPTIWPEDFWQGDLSSDMDLHTAKEAMENCIEAAIGTL